MKKIIAWLLAFLMLCAAAAAPAEKEIPMFKTVSEALEAAGEFPIAGGEWDYYAVVTEKDGKFYRSVAFTDNVYDELLEAALNADVDHIGEAFAAMDEYLMTMPINYTEEITAVPLGQEEIDALAGRTLGELRSAGFRDMCSSLDDEGPVSYDLRWGMYDYTCVVDVDDDAYAEDQLKWPSDSDNFVVLRASLRGLSRDAFLLTLLYDGTEEPYVSSYDDYSEMAEEFTSAAEKIQSGEEVDMDALAGELKEKYPDLADTINTYVSMYNLLGADALLTLINID